jgi:outer membrane protein assembly factor BamE (lipoprotein component of BamABCDE complex)
MSVWPKILTIALLLLISACVSAGTVAIRDAGVLSQIEVGKSTQADVAALLGYPLRASYGAKGEMSWYYTCVTAAPTVAGIVPVVKAFTPSLQDSTRELAVTFNRDGTVKSLGPPPPPPAPVPPAGPVKQQG